MSDDEKKKKRSPIDWGIEAFQKRLMKFREEGRKGEAQLAEDIEKLRRLKTLKEKENLSPKEVEEVMAVTCWGNLAYCCSPKKGCPYFLSVCECLGLDPKEVAEAKEDAISRLLRGKTHDE